MKDILFVRFGVCEALDDPANFNSVADYSFCPDYSDNATVHTIEHVEDSLPVPEGNAPSKRERIVLTEVFNEAQARYDWSTIWLIVADCVSGSISGIDAINYVPVVSPEQFARCEDIKPELEARGILDKGFANISPTHKIADKILARNRQS